MVATAARSRAPSGHDAGARASRSSRVLLLAKAPSSAPPGVGSSALGVAAADGGGALATAPTMPAAAIDARLVAPTTAARLPVTWYSTPPSEGPTMKASVADASLYARNRGRSECVVASFVVASTRSPSLVGGGGSRVLCCATSARKALPTGDEPAKSPLSARSARKAHSGPSSAKHEACKPRPRPAPARLPTRMGLRMPRRSDTWGHTSSPKSMPSG
mmetsp:Transcript_5052/g.20735  ORF Transcript_5052/g.20735 Transcript_5052/m.20735 type:complete len:218 (+) Transcript_5052:1365-2018(+)